MNKIERILRISQLCGNCIRFLAYYRAGNNIKDKHKNGVQIQFWIAVSNGLLNMSVLELCKLFCEEEGKHFWKKGVEDEGEFKNNLFKLAVMKGGEAEFDKYKKEIREYRDKHVAHLDLVTSGRIPKFDIMKETTIFLYDYLHSHMYKDGGVEYECKTNVEIRKLYDDALEEGKKIYDNIDEQYLFKSTS